MSPHGAPRAATLYVYSLLLPNVAARVCAALPVLGSPAGLAAEGTEYAMLLQTVSRGDNLTLADALRAWSKGIRAAELPGGSSC
ncbi:hypothetical protein ACFV2U_31395 [Streptomyces sp. NPDC059697]|uniref:hypothetical protein n=1 Tax=Streptomyces sp. NPDC059697 TaxID=3346912 RepID=UPI0036745730